jgi:hypothetical protein
MKSKSKGKSKTPGSFANLGGNMGQQSTKRTIKSSDDLRENMGQPGKRPKGPGFTHNDPLHTILGQ